MYKTFVANIILITYQKVNSFLQKIKNK